MINISIDDFAEMYVKNNSKEDLKDIKTRFKKALKRKKDGALCSCENKIWAAGSAIVGYNTCFTCLTGEMVQLFYRVIMPRY
ncbi:MAG: hypothetical protein ACOCQA_02275 [bacterium]